MLTSYSNQGKTATRHFSHTKPNNGSIFNFGRDKASSSAGPVALNSRHQHADSEIPAEIQSNAAALLGEGVHQVSIHQNSSKADQINAMAFTRGSEIHFAPGAFNPHTSKGKELIGHELAHAAQQSQGRVSPTAYERGQAVNNDMAMEMEAEQIGKQVAMGHSGTTRTKINQSHIPSPNGAVTQKYAKVSGFFPKLYNYDRVSDDGELAVKDHGKTGYASHDMISEANRKLESMHSIAEVKKTNKQAWVYIPDQPDKVNTLQQFYMIDRKSRKELSLADDCGGANQEVMGSHHHKIEEFKAIYGPGRQKETNSTTYHPDDYKPGGTLSTTEELSAQIYIDIFRIEYNMHLDRLGALDEWQNLTEIQQEAINRKYGINEQAVPQMGQSVTIGSERDMFKSHKEDKYNYHFGYSLMKSGQDYITLEDYADSKRTYYLDMYGPASKNQAWGQDNGNTSYMTDKTTTMVVEHPKNK